MLLCRGAGEEAGKAKPWRSLGGVCKPSPRMQRQPGLIERSRLPKASQPLLGQLGVFTEFSSLTPRAWQRRLRRQEFPQRKRVFSAGDHSPLALGHKISPRPPLNLEKPARLVGDEAGGWETGSAAVGKSLSETPSCRIPSAPLGKPSRRRQRRGNFEPLGSGQ